MGTYGTIFVKFKSQQIVLWHIMHWLVELIQLLWKGRAYEFISARVFFPKALDTLSYIEL